MIIWKNKDNGLILNQNNQKLKRTDQKLLKLYVKNKIITDNRKPLLH